MAATAKYTEELADKICEKIATSTKGLRHICEELSIGYSTVRRWINENNHPIRDKYTRAKQLQIEHMAEEILEISDDKANDTIDGEFGKQGNAAAVNRSRLQVDSRKWLLSKLDPKKYGDKMDVTSGGEKLPTTINILLDKGTDPE